MANILIIRFSALGDVAMTVPVIYSLAQSYPQHKITVLSNGHLKSLFAYAPSNVEFIGVNLKKDYKGFLGLNRLFRELKSKKFDYVADLHDVLRSKYLRFRFSLKGIPVAHIDKGRDGKKALTRREGKVLIQQPSSFDRYKKVFEDLGFPFELHFESIYGTDGPAISVELGSLVGLKTSCERWIGIAPFAKHKEKTYPPELMEQVIAHFSENTFTKVFLFGGKEDASAFAKWTAKYPTVRAVNGKLGMEDELLLMSQLDVMVSMDSANMHFASLVNTPVVSIWGATHPYAGFMGWGQKEEHVLQLDLSCRPCSVFGNKPCFRGDWACMYGIAPSKVIEAIENIKKGA